MLRVVRFTKTKEENYKRVYHRRNNKEIVNILCMKDVAFSYNVNGEKRMFFIVDCEAGDCIRYGCEQKYDINYMCYEEESSIVREMFEGILKKNKPLPKNTDELLRDLLPYAFLWLERPKFYIFDDYKFVLEKLNKNANNYVSQKATIDVFIKTLCDVHAITYLESLIKSPAIDVSVELYELYKKAQNDVKQTIEMVKDYISEKTYNVTDFNYKTYIFTETIYGTPCGMAEVTFILDEGFKIQLKVNNKMGMHTEFTITDELSDLKDKIFK